MKQFVIIVAGGTGLRFGSELPKQFLLMHGKPVLMHTIEAFYRFNAEIGIVLVLPNNHLSYWKQLCEKYSFTIRHSITNGGETRFQSVKNGLNTIHKEGIIGIHDGVRPLVSIETIQRCYKTAAEKGNAIPVIALIDSVRIIQEQDSKPYNREILRIVQTPQVFHSSILRKAYQQDYSPEFTDDATVVEKLGIQINLVEGNYENIKITNPLDLTIANAFLIDREM